MTGPGYGRLAGVPYLECGVGGGVTSLPNPLGTEKAQFRSQDLPGESLTRIPCHPPPLLLTQKPKVSWEA